MILSNTYLIEKLIFSTFSHDEDENNEYNDFDEPYEDKIDQNSSEIIKQPSEDEESGEFLITDSEKNESSQTASKPVAAKPTGLMPNRLSRAR